MALKPCRECGSEISDQAPTCPRCGAPNSEGSQARSLRPAQARPGLVRQLIGLVVLGALGVVAYRVYTGQSVQSAVSGPQTIVDETMRLEEGQAKSYGFSLPTSRRVDVSIKASPHQVNIMLMDEAQWNKYKEVKGSLFGGDYTYKQALSKQSILEMSESDILPEGRWRIVVERPNESLILGDDTNATVKVLAY